MHNINSENMPPLPLEAPIGGSAEAAQANATPIKVGSSSDQPLQPAGVISLAAAQSSPIHTPNLFALSYGAPNTAPPAAGPTPVLAAPTAAAPTAAAPAAVAVVPAAGNASDSNTDTQTSQQALSAMGDQKIEDLTKKLQNADAQVEELAAIAANAAAQVATLTREKQELEDAYQEAVVEIQAEKGSCLADYQRRLTAKSRDERRAREANEIAEARIGELELQIEQYEVQAVNQAQSSEDKARIGELELQIEQYEVQAVNQAQSSEEMFEELRDQYEARVLEQTDLANVAQFKLKAEIASNNELRTVAGEAETRAGVAETHAAEAERRAADLARQLRVAEVRAVAEGKRAVQAEERAAGLENRAVQAEERVVAAGERAVQAEERAAGLETRVVAAGNRAVAAEERAAGLEPRAVQAEERAAGLGTRAVAAEERAVGLETRAAAAEGNVKRLEDYANQQYASYIKASKEAKAALQQLEDSNTRCAQLLLDLSNAHAAAETTRIQNDAANAIVQSEVQKLTEKLIAADEDLAKMNEASAEKDDQIKSLKVSCLVSKETKDKASKLDGCQRDVHMERGRVQTAMAEKAKLLQQHEEDVKDLTAENANHEKAYRELEMKYEQVKKELKDGVNRQSNASLERERDSRKREEESRHRHHRNGSDSDRNRKRSRDDERDHRNQRERHNNYNVDTYRSGADYPRQDRRREDEEAHRRHDHRDHDHHHRDHHRNHRNHNHQRQSNGNGSNRDRSSERRTTPHPSPPPTTFQQIDNSQQVLPISTEPPQDPRQQQRQQRPQESREEGELNRKKEPFQ